MTGLKNKSLFIETSATSSWIKQKSKRKMHSRTSPSHEMKSKAQQLQQQPPVDEFPCVALVPAHEKSLTALCNS